MRFINECCGGILSYPSNDVAAAMRSEFRYKQRPSGEWVAVGLDGNSRLIEMVYLYNAEKDFFFCVSRDDTPEPKDTAGTGFGKEIAMTSIEEFMRAQGLTDEMLDQMAAPYERGGDFELSNGKVHVGSHIDAVGKKRVTVVYPAADTRRVAALARAQGVRRPSDIFRRAGAVIRGWRRFWR